MLDFVTRVSHVVLCVCVCVVSTWFVWEESMQKEVGKIITDLLQDVKNPVAYELVTQFCGKWIERGATQILVSKQFAAQNW